MKLRFSSFIAAAFVAILSPLSGCSDDPDDTGAGGAGGTDAGSTSASVSASSAVGSGGAGGAGSTSASTGTGGDGGSTGSGSGQAPTFETLQYVVQNACWGAGCHNDEMNPLDLMIDGELHTRVSSHVTKNCGNLIDTGNPEESGLIRILKGPCGGTPRMPLECVSDGDAACIPPDYIEALTQWIADGAQE
ncbi:MULTISPECIES: hypothetical protein [Sorangium]|uniref:Exported protein n=1 Tax=Sorangium cellulosum (strain So ce56) TaxID=448385 RepID=A9GXG2_SORC5|nr:hypothetical protein [Sorangium cellulosum]CAN97086.1 putative exported protein [Sorangium cellulosum So ce56]